MFSNKNLVTTIFSAVLYALWISAIIFILSATFTNFQYEDLNALAGVFLVFAIINSFFIVKKK